MHFKIDGPAVIAGVDNADLKDFEPYVANTRKAWKGKALVVIKSKHEVGDIKLTVSSPTLGETSINLKMIKL